jgi:hypothetical protein
MEEISSGKKLETIINEQFEDETGSAQSIDETK